MINIEKMFRYTKVKINIDLIKTFSTLQMQE